MGAKCSLSARLRCQTGRIQHVVFLRGNKNRYMAIWHRLLSRQIFPQRLQRLSPLPSVCLCSCWLDVVLSKRRLVTQVDQIKQCADCLETPVLFSRSPQQVFNLSVTPSQHHSTSTSPYSLAPPPLTPSPPTSPLSLPHISVRLGALVSPWVNQLAHKQLFDQRQPRVFGVAAVGGKAVRLNQGAELQRVRLNRVADNKETKQ